VTNAKIGLAQAGDGTLNANTITVFVSSHAAQKITVTGNGTIDITPQGSLVNGGLLFVINGGAGTITWTGVDDWIGGAAPTLPASGNSLIAFIHDSAGNVIGNYVGDYS
jgi:hypothetical protein